MARKILSIEDADDTPGKVIVCVHCSQHRQDVKYLLEKYPGWEIFNTQNVTSIEDTLRHEIGREFMRSAGIDIPSESIITAKVFGVTDKTTALLMKLEMGNV